MAGSGDVHPVSHAPCTQPEMAAGNWNGQIYTSAHSSNGVGRSDSPLYAWLDGQRYPPVAVCIHVSAEARRL